MGHFKVAGQILLQSIRSVCCETEITQWGSAATPCSRNCYEWWAAMCVVKLSITDLFQWTPLN